MAQVTCSPSRRGIRSRVFKALSVFGFVQALTVLCQVVRTKFTALWIGAVGTGVIGLYNSTMDILTNICQLNLRQSAVADISATADDERRALMAVSVRRVMFLTGLAGTLVAGALAPLLSRWTFGDSAHTGTFLLLAPMMLFSAVTASEQAVMQAYDRLTALARSSALATVTAVAISLPLLYLYRFAAIGPVLLLYSVTNCAFALIYRVRGIRTQQRPSLRHTLGAVRRMVSLGFYMTACYTADLVFSWFFAIYLNKYYGTADVGIYRSGFTLVNTYIGVVFTAISMEYFPRLASGIGRRLLTRVTVDYQSMLSMGVVAPLIVLFVVFCPLIVRLLFSHEFDAMTPFVSIAMAAIPMRAVSWCMAFTLLAKGDGPAYAVTETISGAVCLAFNILFFRWWGFAGLGYAYFAWYAVYIAMIYGVYRFRYGLKLGKATLFSLLGVTVASWLCLVCNRVLGQWYTLAIFLPAALIYGAGVWRVSRR